MKNSKQLKLGIFIIFLSLFSTTIYAESLDDLIANDIITSKDGNIHVDTTKYKGDTPISIIQTRPGAYRLNYGDAQQDVILVLDTEPETNPFEGFMVSSGISEKKTLNQKKHEKFKKSIEKVESILSKKGFFGISSKKEKIKKKELELIGAVALKADSKKIDELKASDAVKAVYPDEIITLDITESAELLNATKVWAMQNSSGNNITGEGITIAIIDSGIDYTHPDLGACNTSEFLEGSCEKIIGGYDFVNDDNDPFDDNGHGTHCAGIAAADGTLKGIAPKAKLLALKPMNSGGSGSTSDIVAAIENATNAGADIISLSLGGSGDENSPLSVAANNAFMQGVIVVSSAGNSGPLSNTINAPGTANFSLTVGATNYDDEVQSFSSRGPTANYNIKPDVLAPGYYIESTVPTGSCTHCTGSGYKELPGTSMSCPMVSGTAALLKQAHPGWNNEEIRAAIINTAIDVGESIHTQGTGRVDSLKAINTDAVITPTSKSFGVDESINPDFNETQIFTIKNLGDSAINYNLSTDIGQAGITATFNQTEFSIPAGQTRNFEFNLYVNNSILANGGYEGYIYANGTDNLRIPLYFMKSSMSEIHLKESGAHAEGVVHIHDRNDTKYTYETTSPLRIPIDPGVYDIVVKFGDSVTFEPGDKWVIRENVMVNDSTITINAEEAVHLVNYSFKDIDNQSISYDNTKGLVSARDFRYAPNKNLLNHWSLKFASSAIVEFETLPIYVSNMSEDYALMWRHPFDYQDSHYDEYGIVTNITSDHLFDLGPDTMKKIRAYYPDITDYYNLGYYGRCDSLGWTIDGMQKRLYADMFYTPLNDANYWCKPNALIALDQMTSDELIRSPNFYAVNTSHMKTELSDNTVWLKDDLIYKVSESGHFWYAEFLNENDRIYALPYIGNQSRFFYTQTYDNVNGMEQSYELYDSGTFDSGGSLDTINFSITQGVWSLIIENNFTLNTIENSARINATFDTSLADKDPPALEYMHMYTDNLYSDFVYTKKTNEFEFKVDPLDGAIASVNMWYNNGSWNSIALTNIGNIYNATVPSGITTTKVRFRILAVDDSGNSLDYEFDLLTDLGADFKTSSISLSEDTPEYGDNIIIDATVENIGIRPGEDIEVKFYDNSGLIGTDTINSIEASSSAVASASYIITETGLRNITVVADPSNLITEINESNNQYSSYLYYKSADEQLLTEFPDSSSSRYLNMTDNDNDQLNIQLPVYSKVNYALLDIEGEKILLGEKEIDQPTAGGTMNIEETNWASQSINITENRVSRFEMTLTPRDNTSIITEPPFIRIRKDDVVNGDDITQAIVPRESFDDSYIENKDGNRGYRWKSFNFSDYDPLTPDEDYYLVFGTLDPYPGAAYVYKISTSDEYPGGMWYSSSGTGFPGRDFQFSLYTENISYITNLSFYAGNEYNYNYSGYLYTLKNIPDFSSNINVSQYTDENNDSYVEIPLNFTTEKAGYLNISNLKIYYDLADIAIENLTLSPNPVDRGANITITAVIKNNASADITTDLIINTTKEIINRQITIPAGQIKSFNQSINTSAYNSTEIKAVIDNDNYII
ncbi:S8 family serine peptidase, partial [Candidatus Woesearchaeota archaeon]|nr:S8 family serine peptidase [Candidatus Woesearchaeota archaeon]